MADIDVEDLYESGAPPELTGAEGKSTPEEPKAADAAASTEGDKTADGDQTADNESATAADDEGEGSKSEKGLYAEMKAERGKRQQAEASVRELGEKVARLEGLLQGSGVGQGNKQSKDPEEEIDYFDDPERFISNQAEKVFRSQIKNIKPRLKLDIGANFYRQQHEDFGEATQAFLDAMGNDPTLEQRMYSHPDPALFAYQYGKNLQHFSGFEDIDEYKQKVIAEALPDLEAEWRKKQGIEAASQVAQTNAAARGSGVSAQPASVKSPQAIIDEAWGD